jgi:hypothetical protein
MISKKIMVLLLSIVAISTIGACSAIVQTHNIQLGTYPILDSVNTNTLLGNNIKPLSINKSVTLSDSIILTSDISFNRSEPYSYGLVNNILNDSSNGHDKVEVYTYKINSYNQRIDTRVFNITDIDNFSYFNSSDDFDGYVLKGVKLGHVVGKFKYYDTTNGEAILYDYDYEIKDRQPILSVTNIGSDEKINPDNDLVKVGLKDANDLQVSFDDVGVVIDATDNTNNKVYTSHAANVINDIAIVDLGNLPHGDRNYTLRPRLVDTNGQTQSVLPNLVDVPTLTVESKIRTKLVLETASGNVVWNKYLPVNSEVKYKFVDEDNKPIANKSINFLGSVYKSNDDGYVSDNFTSYGNISINAAFANVNDPDYQNTSTSNWINLVNVAGPGKKIITHTASSGGSLTESHWDDTGNGFSFSEDGDWILAFKAGVHIRFYDVNGIEISRDDFQMTSGSSDHETVVPDSAATMKFECGVQSGGDWSWTPELVAGPGAIKFDGTAAKSISTRNCHVKTDTWDSGHIKLYDGLGAGTYV